MIADVEKSCPSSLLSLLESTVMSPLVLVPQGGLEVFLMKKTTKPTKFGNLSGEVVLFLVPHSCPSWGVAGVSWERGVSLHHSWTFYGSVELF